MGEQYVGEIRLFGFTYMIRDWAPCLGQLLPISGNTVLFSLIGVRYGGDGVKTFGLPNLQGVAVMGAGQGPGLSSYTVGETGGAAAVKLDVRALGAHSHPMTATVAVGTTRRSAGNQLARGFAGSPDTGVERGLLYSRNPPTSTLAPNAIAFAGDGGEHNNMQPYLVLNWCIALSGLAPHA